MEIKLPYGKESTLLRLPPGIEADFVKPADMAPLSDIEATLLAALAKPIGVPPLEDSLSSDSSVVILIADITRARGTDKLLPLVIGYLTDAGVEPGAIKVLVTRGAHRGLTKAEKGLLRSTAASGVRVEEHDCDDASSLSALLLTHRGTPVRTNVALKDVDAIVLLSPVSFHYFAGFGGGRKLVLPGAADRAAIVANHKLSLIEDGGVALHPRCRPGVLDGNPIHEDMCETLGALHGVFGINFFNNASGEISFVNAGDAQRAHGEACDAYRDVYLRRVERRYPVAVLSAGGFPHDINLLQSHKALRHAARGVEPGGTILYFAKCEEGVGSPTLETALRMERKKFEKVAHKEYALNYTTAVSLHDLTDTFEIGMVSAMNVDLLLSLGIKSCVNTESFLAQALEKHQTNRLGVVSQGSSLLLDSEAGER